MLCEPSSGCGAQVLSTGEAKLSCGTWLLTGQSPRCCRAQPAGHGPSPRHRGPAAKVLLEQTSWLPAAQLVPAGGFGRLFWQVLAGWSFSPFPTVVLPVSRHGDVCGVQRQAPLQPHVQHPQHRCPRRQQLPGWRQQLPGV